MKRIHTLIACGAVTAASCAALAAAPLAAQAATVNKAERMVGGKMQPILVTESGMTIYEFTADKKHKNHCVEEPRAGQGCPTIWPALTVTETPTAGEGIKQTKLGTITLPDMEKQVTFKKHPLYTYSGDSPGTTYYVGQFQFEGYWWALTPKGMVVK